MDFSPLNASAQPIPLHAYAALAAIFLGAGQLVLPKGTLVHRATGYVWIGLMGIVSVSSFWIYSLKVWGDYSPIHLLSILTLGTLIYSLWAIRTGQVLAHKWSMISLYFLALILTGLFTLLPGRVMHEVVF